MVKLFFIEYIIMAIICYFGFKNADLNFYQKGEKVELKESFKKKFLIWMSALWIIYLPMLIISWFEGDD